MSKDQNPSDKTCDAYFDNPYAATSGSYYSDRVTFYAGFASGAASRDAEVVSLTNQRDYEYVRAENAEQERDQFREQLAGYKQDAERYRFIRDNPWNGTELESVITCHLNAVWDLSIDEAIRARGEGK